MDRDCPRTLSYRGLRGLSLRSAIGVAKNLPIFNGRDKRFLKS